MNDKIKERITKNTDKDDKSRFIANKSDIVIIKNNKSEAEK